MTIQRAGGLPAGSGAAALQEGGAVDGWGAAANQPSLGTNRRWGPAVVLACILNLKAENE